MRTLLLLAVLSLPPLPAAAQALLHEVASPNGSELGFFGASTAGVPDVDGDGRGDLLVGAPLEHRDSGPLYAGRAYVFSGATGALLHELASPNEQYYGQFGFAVSGVEDVDGDGRGDLLVGAPREDGAREDAGRVYVFSGASGELLHELISPNEQGSGFFGSSVAMSPDVDGDGRADLLVGAPWEHPGSSPRNAGRAYVFSGATGALLRTLVSPNPQEDGFFGRVVSGVEDVDGDGRGDLLVGAYREGAKQGPNYAGRAYVFSGATGALLHELASPNEQNRGQFGVSVSGVPDSNGDGRGDLLVGAPGEEPGDALRDAGRAYVFSGATGALLHTLAAPDEEEGGFFGRAVSGVEDVDGDGRGDLLVGASDQAADGSLPEAGQAYVFSGATGALLRSLSSPNEEGAGYFGDAISGVQDADGDGVADLLVGAPGEEPGDAPEDAGRAYVFSGAVLTAVEEGEAPPALALAVRPNPVSSRVVITYVLPEPSEVQVRLYDVLGQEVAVLGGGALGPGRHETAFDGSRLPAGTYIVRLEVGGAVQTRRVTFVR